MKILISILLLTVLPFASIRAQQNKPREAKIEITEDISEKAPSSIRAVQEKDLISGNPEHRTWYLDQNKSGVTFGIWEGTIGKWRFSIEHWEYCRILSGESIVTDSETGKSFHIKVGDSFILQPGFSGTWEVLSTTRKEFIVR